MAQGFDQRTDVGRYHDYPPSQWTEGGGPFLQSILIHQPPLPLPESRFLRTPPQGNFCTSSSSSGDSCRVMEIVGAEGLMNLEENCNPAVESERGFS